MALDWLNRIGPSKGEYLIEKVALIYTALTSIVIVVLFNQMDHPLKMLIEALHRFMHLWLYIYLSEISL